MIKNTNQMDKNSIIEYFNNIINNYSEQEKIIAKSQEAVYKRNTLLSSITSTKKEINESNPQTYVIPSLNTFLKTDKLNKTIGLALTFIIVILINIIISVVFDISLFSSESSNERLMHMIITNILLLGFTGFALFYYKIKKKFIFPIVCLIIAYSALCMFNVLTSGNLVDCIVRLLVAIIISIMISIPIFLYRYVKFKKRENILKITEDKNFQNEFEQKKIELNNNIDKMNKELNEINKVILNLDSNIKSISVKIENLFNDISLHQVYRDVYAITKFKEYLSKGRCDNIKECINLYEQEIQTAAFQNELKAKNQRQISQIEQMKNAMNSIKNEMDQTKNEMSQAKQDIKEAQKYGQIAQKGFEGYISNYGSEKAIESYKKTREKVSNEKV